MAFDPHSVWFVSGCSSGFGREIAKRVLALGGRCVLTARDKASVAELVAAHPDCALALDLDVTRRDQVADAVEAAQAHFGRIDVLVNNAGYGYMASCEEGEEAEVRAQFEVNLFGLIWLTQAVIPAMRARRSGHIINIGSTSGFVAGPGGAFYCASKHAVEGWSQALTREMKPFGVRVTCVAPGAFRTDWAGRSLRQTQTRIEDYTELVGGPLSRTANFTGRQPGDPKRGAELIVSLSELAAPPAQIVLGSRGMELVETRLKESLEEIGAWRDQAVATDFPT